MAAVPRYKSDSSVLDAICAALREGASKLEAGRCARPPVALGTLEGWIDKDPKVRERIEGAIAWGATAREVKAATPAPSKAPKPVDRWERARTEAEALAPGETLYGWLLWLESKIAAHNERAPEHDRFPVMTAWMLGDLRAFWRSGKQEYLLRAGRGLGKSTMFCRVTVVECLAAPRSVNAGEVAIWPELSVDMDEANLKVSVIERLLMLLGFSRAREASDRGEPGKFVTYKRELGRTRISFLNVHGEAIEVRVYPATVAAMSGPTMKGARNDEESKWKADSKAGINSAEDVLDAQGGAFRGRPWAHLYRISSAYRTKGPHFDDIEAGDTSSRYVARIGAAYLETVRAGFELRASISTPEDAAEIRAYAATLDADSPNIPSWINPSLDPCTLKARNVRVFLREYGSRSSGAENDGDFFDGTKLDAAVALEVPRGDGSCYCAIDPGSRRNAFALAIVRRVETDEATAFVPVVLREWIPAPGAPLDLRLDVLPAAARLAKAHGCEEWVTDAHALTDVELVGVRYGLTTRCRAEGDAFESEFSPVRDAIHRGECPLSGCPGADELVAQLRQVSSAPGDRGHTRMILPDGDGLHGDLARAYVSAAAAAGAGAAVSDDGGAVGEPSRYAAEFRRRRVA